MGVPDSLILRVKRTSDCSTAQVVQFFASQVEKLLELTPNIKRSNRFTKIRDNLKIWVLRGYYPGTDIFFKISAVQDTENSHLYGSKYVEPISVRVSSPDSKKRQIFDSSKLANQLADSMLVGAEIDLKLKDLRCLTPKGMKKLSLKKRRKRSKEAKSA